MPEIKDVRLKNCRDLVEVAGSRAKLAENIGISITQLNHYIGIKPIRNIGEKLARKIEASLSLAQGWLDQDHSKKSETQELTPLGKTIKSNIPNVHSLFANSGEINNLEDEKMLDEVLEDEMEAMKLERKNAFWLRVKDDSMKPYIEPGTLTMIDKGKREVVDGMRYALKIDGKVVLRRIYKEKGQYNICCDNIALKTEIRDKLVENFDGEIELIGKMVFMAMGVDKP